MDWSKVDWGDGLEQGGLGRWTGARWTGAMDWIDGWTSHFGDDYYGNATQDVVRVLKQGLGEGWSTEHTMDELGKYLTGPGFNQRRLEVIARTNATSAFNQGRLETFHQAGDFVKFVQFLAILDSRTTDICESRNGRSLRLDSPELASNTPPLHYQCRSMLSPVTTYDLKDMEKPGWKDAEGRTLEQLQDWSKVDVPAKGFGGDIQSKIQKTPEPVAENQKVKSAETLNPSQKSDIIDGKGIDVWIDELTPCLRDGKTGEIIKTEYKAVKSLEQIKKISKEYKWEFDWVGE